MCMIKICPLRLFQRSFSFFNCWVCNVVLHTKGFTRNIARFFVDHFLNHLSIGWLMTYGHCLLVFTGSYCLKSMINTCSCMYNIHIPSFLNIMKQQINKMIITITAITMITTTTITTTRAITVHEIVISIEYTIMYILDHKEHK